MSGAARLKALEAVGIWTVVDRDINSSYDGDHAAIVTFGRYDTPEYDDKHGFVVIGYGSCSGCDAWLACDNPQERFDEMQRVVRSIKWFDDFEQARDHVLNADHGLQWYGHEESWQAFVDAVRDVDSSSKYYDTVRGS